MKLKSFLVALLISASTAMAQAPQLMTYQSVVRDGMNQLLTNSPVGLRLSIVQGSTSGTTIFVETHQTFTNSHGLLSTLIGSGNAVTGTIADINWGNGPYFIKTEIDLDGGTNYLMFGIQQLVSVPYALYAETAGSVINGGGANTPGPQGPAGTNGTNGLSAYELAVQNGFVGTLQDWFNSLRGPQGEPGTGNGTGTPGTDGTNGLSAYELAVQNGFVGTLQEWINSLQGATGQTGPAGTNGINGTNGTNGLSAYELAVQNGFVGTLQEWINSLQGATGSQGPQGPAGPAGPAGTAENIVLNQSGRTVYSSNSLSSPSSFTLIPGLTQTITVPANSIVFITTNGGIQNATTSVNVAATDIAVYVNNAINTNFQQRVAIPNAISGNNFINNWTISGVLPLAAGTHTIAVRAQNVAGSAATQIAGTNSLVKGQLTVLIIKQ